jgi:ribosomal protein S18 acetylase RimI-like enzyme
MLTVAIADKLDAELEAAVARLLPQLSSSARLPRTEELAEIVSAPATVLLVAREQARPVEGFAGTGTGGEPGVIVGMLTLALFRIPTGLRAWVEDVVVDERARGKGVGEALLRRALELARERGATTVDLTSRPSRQPANRLYVRLGFELRETNVYRFDLRKAAGQERAPNA